MSRRIWLVIGCVLALVLCGCTGIPDSSAPQAVKTGLDVQQGVEPILTPAPGADQRRIVSGFLDANGSNDPHHNAARGYLTTEGSNRWSDSRVTVVDNTQVGPVRKGNTILVTGQRIGRVDSSGVYTPETQGDGTGRGAFQVRSTFVVKKVKGEWRIDSLPTGLLITYAQFQQYQQRIIYFYDLAERHLVPDLRYSQLSDPLSLAEWLIERLVDGPRDALQNAVTTELPAQTDPNRVSIDLSGSPVRIRMPGSLQLDSATRNRLAAQLAVTLNQVAQIGQLNTMEIVDGSRPVTVPVIGGVSFNASDFADQIASTDSGGSELYYVNDGAVFDASGRRLRGRLGNGAYRLSSVALADSRRGDDMFVAGVNGDSHLIVGHAASALITTRVQGNLSRPAFVPGTSEAWVGDGSRLYRASMTGVTQLVPITAASGKITGRISAVRLSPEGSRVAMVLTEAGGAQVWLGSVVRDSSGKVRVDSLTAISPQGIAVRDVAWNDPQNLFAVGSDVTTPHVAGIYEVRADGSLWTARGAGDLPGPPNSITVTQKEVAAVSAAGTVWKQSAGTWVSLHGDETRGSDPIYVE
jgi:hypothetical protein